MDFLISAVQLVEETKTKVVEKAGQVKEVAMLKSRINICDEVIKKNYMEIGKLYYEMYKENPQEAFQKACRNISNAYKGKDELEEQLEQAEKRLKKN